MSLLRRLGWSDAVSSSWILRNDVGIRHAEVLGATTKPLEFVAVGKTKALTFVKEIQPINRRTKSPEFAMVAFIFISFNSVESVYCCTKMQTKCPRGRAEELEKSVPKPPRSCCDDQN